MNQMRQPQQSLNMGYQQAPGNGNQGKVFPGGQNGGNVNPHQIPEMGPGGDQYDLNKAQMSNNEMLMKFGHNPAGPEMYM